MTLAALLALLKLTVLHTLEVFMTASLAPIEVTLSAQHKPVDLRAFVRSNGFGHCVLTVSGAADIQSCVWLLSVSAYCNLVMCRIAMFPTVTHVYAPPRHN